MEVRSIKTWFDKGQVISVDDDVQNVVRDLKAVDPRLSVFFNEQSGDFDIVESCLDGTDRLVFSVEELDQRVVDRVRAADHWYGRDTPVRILSDEDDFASQVDRANAELEAANKAAAGEKIRDAGERLHWALDIGPGQNSAGGKISMSGKRHRTKYK